jgi:uncharacterized alpha-E superfamily protein
LEFVTVGDIVQYGLHEYIDQFQSKLNQTALAIYERFFALKPPPASKTNPTVASLITA